MASFAIYRLPRQKECKLVIQREGEPVEMTSLTELNGKSGFVVAPFAITRETPALLIRGEELEVRGLEVRSLEVRSLEVRGEKLEVSGFENSDMSKDYSLTPHLSPLTSHPLTSSIRMRYRIDFANFHAHLLDGAFRKIVLSRCSWQERVGGQSPMELFLTACELYPRMFVSLVYTPKSGMWLMATPEVLLEGSSNQWKTIALAGTMELEGALLDFDTPAGNGQQEIMWSQKNIQEQRYVATYITECLEHFSHDITEEGPYTTRAANLVHLRSDFHFTLDDNRRLGSLVKALHPTPAVCGLPKTETFDFITHNESAPRRYYSGFCGPLDAEKGTHLFVSLRCMEMFSNGYMLYAGGGLLRDSQEEQEWAETEAKLETMRKVVLGT